MPSGIFDPAEIRRCEEKARHERELREESEREIREERAHRLRKGHARKLHTPPRTTSPQGAVRTVHAWQTAQDGFVRAVRTDWHFAFALERNEQPQEAHQP